MPEPGRVYDGAMFEYVTPEEYARRTAHREELAFRRRLRQGELAAPSVISDSLGVHGLKSMADGRFYDSKSNMRRHYREAGVIEVGNDVPMKRVRPKPDRQGAVDAAERALCALEVPD